MRRTKSAATGIGSIGRISSSDDKSGSNNGFCWGSNIDWGLDDQDDADSGAPAVNAFNASHTFHTSHASNASHAQKSNGSFFTQQTQQYHKSNAIPLRKLESANAKNNDHGYGGGDEESGEGGEDGDDNSSSSSSTTSSSSSGAEDNNKGSDWADQPIRMSQPPASIIGTMVSVNVRNSDIVHSKSSNGMSRSNSNSLGNSVSGGNINSTMSKRGNDMNDLHKSGLRRTLTKASTPNAPNAPTAPNARTAALGRSLLSRPSRPSRPDVTKQLDYSVNKPFDKFTASAALTPIPRVGTDVTLKSCLSSSSLSSSNRLSSCGKLASSGGLGGMGTKALSSLSAYASYAGNANGLKNETFCSDQLQGQESPMNAGKRNVSFSKIRIREYEVTLGDNPAVSSGAPQSLGWRYDPRETISNCEWDTSNTSNTGNTPVPNAVESSKSTKSTKNMPRKLTMREVRSELRLTEHERHKHILQNPSVSLEEFQEMLRSVAMTRLERKVSLTELRLETCPEVIRLRQEKKQMEEMMQQHWKERRNAPWEDQQKTQAFVEERNALRRRRHGIMDGGLKISQSLASLS